MKEPNKASERGKLTRRNEEVDNTGGTPHCCKMDSALVFVLLYTRLM